MKFSPRLSQILFILLNSKDPIPAVTLAKSMNISKRTVFRELENIDKDLSKFDLTLETKSKKGINIIGNDNKRKQLLNILESSQEINPVNKEERQDKLILELLKQDDYQKIYYYASKFKVSESTINNDLDAIEIWLNNNKLNLVRKSGLGIYLEYEENDYRKACLNYITRDLDNVFDRLAELVPIYFTEKIIDILNNLKSYKIKAISEGSYKELIVYLSIMANRIIMGKRNEIQNKDSSIDECSIDYVIVNELAEALGKTFLIRCTQKELLDIYIQLKSLKLQHISQVKCIDDYEINDSDISIQDMVYKMIHQYDKVLAHQLKQDNDFVKGLIAHIKPTLVRLKHGIEIQNQYQEDIKKSYQEIYEKAKNAAKVMECMINCKIPEAEIGLIAVHFGGAEVGLKQNLKLIKKVNLGVVCSSGIGISALLASKINNHFNGKVHVKRLSMSDLNSDNIEEIDILISTLDLQNTNYSYIKVNPILKKEDFESIGRAIESVSKTKGDIKNTRVFDILPKMEEISLISQEISSIIRSFDLYKVDSNIRFKDLITFVSEILGDNHDKKIRIEEGLKKREQQSTQVIPEFEFVLLHATTKAVELSKLIIVRPDESIFRDNYFLGSKAVVVMLIPEDDPRQVLAISSVSNALFDDDIFLEDVKNSNKEIIKKHVEIILKDFLTEQIKSL